MRAVKLEAYKIARYLVTVADFGRFMDDDGYKENRWWSAGGFRRWTDPHDWADQHEYPNRPVVGVSWFESSAYAKWAGGRLPTESEWERAARGTDGRRYPWGAAPPDADRLNCDRKVGRSTPVGVFAAGAGPSGIQDMAGNVWEWCADVVDFVGTRDGRVTRGGSWYTNSSAARSAFRDYIHPDYRYPLIGCRVVWAVSARTR